MATETKINIDDTYMNVIRFGTGSRNLVIISGVSLCGLEGQGAGVEAAYQMFAEDFTVYLFDRKKVIPKGYEVQDMAEDICRVLAELCVEKADFYGVSQGGMMAQCIAIHHPEMVNKLVLCSTLCQAGERMKKRAIRWQELAAQKDVVGLNRNFFDVVYSKPFLQQNAEILPVLEKMGTPEDCERFEILARACEIFDVADQVEKIQCPVLVLGDENDDTTGAEGSYELAKRLNCEIFMYHQYGHAVFDEAPDIKEKIMEFLR